MSQRELNVKGKTLGADRPMVCSALVGRTASEIEQEVEQIVDKNPDFLEWRVDFFQNIDQTESVIETAQFIQAKANGLPLIFTIRSEREGGEQIPLSEQQRVEMLKEVCRTNSVDLIDYEQDNDRQHVREVREAAQQNGVKLILSYHNFEATPSKAYMLKKLYSSEFHGGDIGKLAVMPNSMEDVLNVLQITHEASRHVHIPIITMSMGTQGALTRLIGWKFGSALTFAVGSESSAPGQIPIEVMEQVERYVTDDIN